MKCRSCECEIPPAFVTAIANNSCPGCGNEIMSSGDKDLLDELAAAMEKMPNDPQGLAGWLLSNYDLRKVGSAEPVERFNRPVQRTDKNNFMERAEAKVKPNLAERARQLKNNPQTAALADAISGLEEDEENEEIEDDAAFSEDMAARKAMEKEFLANNKQQRKTASPTKGIVTANDLRAMLKSKQAPQASDFFDEPDQESDDFEGDSNDEGYVTENEKALMAIPEGRKILNAERMKRINAQNALRSGGGSFKR